MNLDRDLLAIQQMRNAVEQAWEAQQQLRRYTQEQIDRIVAAMARAGEQAAVRLAELAVQETGMGVVEHKTIKNLLATRDLYNHIKDMKTVGVIRRDEATKVVEIAEPVGVIAALVPTTNPTSTAMYKAIIAVKARNAIVMSPHPRAIRCTCEAARVVAEAAVEAGAPEGLIHCLETVDMAATNELMRHPKVSLILATGGAGMVKAAYQSGTPALGVGPGNVPAFIERSADVPKAVSYVVAGKTFDNGTICASEQAVIADEPIAEQVMSELRRQGGYFLSPEQVDRLSAVAFRSNGAVNPAIVGQPATRIAEMAGIDVPPGTRVLVAPLEGVGPQYPLSREKLSPILAFYTAPDWRAACERCIELLNMGGIGHTLAIHSRNEEVIMAFAMEKPVFRIVVNTPATHGAVGVTTGLAPALTLGSGTWGGSATSDNVGPLHLINIKRLAYGVREPEGCCAAPQEPDIERIVRAVLAQLNTR